MSPSTDPRWYEKYDDPRDALPECWTIIEKEVKLRSDGEPGDEQRLQEAAEIIILTQMYEAGMPESVIMTMVERESDLVIGCDGNGT